MTNRAASLMKEVFMIKAVFWVMLVLFVNDLGIAAKYISSPPLDQSLKLQVKDCQAKKLSSCLSLLGGEILLLFLPTATRRQRAQAVFFRLRNYPSS
ncbi:MAG: hypothetical protein HRU19_06705 [Pseudobacteriovorax sp.]|nr:hypothetical protein [Pseudobacteriovorax sp.]